MEAWQWGLVALAAVIVIGLVVWSTVRARQRKRVVEHFGPEYERAVAERGDRRAAEHDLLDRTRRRDQLELRPLTPEARIRHYGEWRVIQARFVDNPGKSITDADQLLNRVMGERGYPVSDFNEKADLVSVDHPDLVDQYRQARRVQERNSSRMASTDELREALLRYRSMFRALLDADTSTTSDEAVPHEVPR